MKMYHKNSKIISTIMFVLLAYGTSANADVHTFNCSFLRQHSSSEVTMALSYAKLVVGDSEANRLYGHYISLKNACRINPDAKQSINLSNEMFSLVSSR